MNTKTSWLQRSLLLAALILVPLSAAAADEGETKCHWWQLQCDDERQIEGLPPEAPRSGVVITVDVSRNRAYLFKDGQLVDQGLAATGSEKLLRRGSRVWLFRTPRGRHRVLRKIEGPVWRKPDWAFLEEGEAVPPPDSPKRLVKGKLGKYALDLGDGIMIHGTDDPSSLGRAASHGCIRLPDAFLRDVYRAASVGTDVYVFESRSPVRQAKGPERHSDLDF